MLYSGACLIVTSRETKLARVTRALSAYRLRILAGSDTTIFCAQFESGLCICFLFTCRIVSVCVCVFSSHSIWTSSSLDVPVGVTQEEGHTGFLIHVLSAVRALIFLARRIQPILTLVDREVEFCVLTNDLIVLHPLGFFFLVFFLVF